MDSDNITSAEYTRLQDYIYKRLGNVFDDNKRETMNAKIARLMRKQGIKKTSDYVNYILTTQDVDAIQEFFNEITTNTTEFFREPAHFDYIKNNISNIIDEIPRIKREREIRLWSAPCSSGEESVTLAVVLLECLPPDISIRILATDISKKVLRKEVERNNKG